MLPALLAAGGLSDINFGLTLWTVVLFVLFAVDNVLGFLIALVAGTLVAAAAVIALKSFTEDKSEVEELETAAV